MRALCMFGLTCGVTTRQAYLLRDDGRAGIGPWYSDGPARWVKPGERPDDRIVDTDDLDTLRAEVAEHGGRHLRWLLIDAGLAHEVSVTRFNRVAGTLSNVVDHQYDHGGIAIGIRTEYACPALGLEWASEVG